MIRLFAMIAPARIHKAGRGSNKRPDPTASFPEIQPIVYELGHITSAGDRAVPAVSCRDAPALLHVEARPLVHWAKLIIALQCGDHKIVSKRTALRQLISISSAFAP
jgi:hypothetical protein